MRNENNKILNVILRNSFLLVFIILFIFLVFFNRGTYSGEMVINNGYGYEYVLTEIKDNNGNVPAYEYYDDVFSRSIWSLKAYDGKIFMGLGDYGENTGPVKVLYYDTSDGKVKSSGTITDEAIEKFSIIDGKLYTTGTDPTNDLHGYGSYYIYDEKNDFWKQYEFNNGWVHVFDIVKFDNRIFMSGSINTEEYNNSIIQASSDNGISFSDVDVYYNDINISSLNSYLRIYDMVEYNDNLYAWLIGFYSENKQYDGLYRYNRENKRFEYIDSNFTNFSSDINTGVDATADNNYTNFNGLVFDNKFIFFNGDQLLMTEDFITFKEIDGTNSSNLNVAKSNALVVDGYMYLLTYKYNKSNKNFNVIIYSTNDLIDFNKEYEFISVAAPYSFEYYNSSFYVGTIYSDKVKKAGNLYKIDRKKINNNEDVKFDDDIMIDNDVIYNIDLGITVSLFKNKINTDGDILIYDVNRRIKDDNDRLATGDILVINLSNNVFEYMISVNNDIDGNGDVDSSDIVLLRKHIVEFINPDTGVLEIQKGVYKLALDVCRDGSIDSLDLILMRKRIVGLV